MTKEEAIKVLKNIVKHNEDEDAAIFMAIRALNEQHPSLPSNLDEAAIVTEVDKFLQDPVFGKQLNRNAAIALAKHFHQAGAEWMAEQGVTFESVVEEWSNPSGHRELSGLEEILKDFNWQDKVIVQIRKK